MKLLGMSAVTSRGSETTQAPIVGPEDLRKRIRLRIEAARRGTPLPPLFIWGPPGQGKSQIVRETASEEKATFYSTNLNAVEPPALHGYPFLDRSGGVPRTLSSIPLIYPKEEGVVVRLFDDLTNAPLTSQNVLYEVFNSRRAGEYELPPNLVLVGAGNRPTDKSGAFPLSHAFGNRVLQVTLVTSAREWIPYALRRGVDTRIVAFVARYPDMLNAGEGTPCATPRSWERMWEEIRFQSEVEGRPPLFTKDVVCGYLGNEVGMVFLQFVRRSDELGIPEVFSLADAIVEGRIDSPQSPLFSSLSSDKKYLVLLSVLQRMEPEALVEWILRWGPTPDKDLAVLVCRELMKRGQEGRDALLSRRTRFEEVFKVVLKSRDEGEEMDE